MHPQREPSTAVLHRPLVDAPRTPLHTHFAQLQDPSVALQILRDHVPAAPARVQAVCTPQKFLWRAHGRVGRFVVRVDTATTTGERDAFAFKGYLDDGGGRIMRAFGALTTCPECPPDTCPVSPPLAYLPQERVLISRWAHGESIWAHLERGDEALLAHIPCALAQLAQAQGRPQAAATSAQTLLDGVLAKCEQVCTGWPAAAATVQPLMAALQEALPLLDPTPPALVHGDLHPRNCLWNGRHVTLIDLDSFRYTDPAYDAGKFLAALHRKSLGHPALMARMPQMRATFRRAYLAAVPTVSARNIAFYYALTFARKIYRALYVLKVPVDWPEVVAMYVHYAMCALQTGV